MSFWLGGLPYNLQQFNSALRTNGAKRFKLNHNHEKNSTLYVWAQWPPKYAQSAIYYKGRIAPTFQVSNTAPGKNYRKLGAFLDAAMAQGSPIMMVHIQVLGVTRDGSRVMYGSHNTNLLE